jgi:hypothetical protein
MIKNNKNIYKLIKKRKYKTVLKTIVINKKTGISKEVYAMKNGYIIKAKII